MFGNDHRQTIASRSTSNKRNRRVQPSLDRIEPTWEESDVSGGHLSSGGRSWSKPDPEEQELFHEPHGQLVHDLTATPGDRAPRRQRRRRR
jgi:hypothetical protein